MIGNDVIDIVQSRKESNWQRRGFVDKLFTNDEQQLIKSAADPEIAVWLLWSMKEAAYKIYNRQSGIRAYIPRKLTCNIILQSDLNVFGTVNYSGHTYYTETLIDHDHINTIAVTSVNHFKAVTEAEVANILKNELGIPYLIKNNTRYDASISHHGRFKKLVTIDIPSKSI